MFTLNCPVARGQASVAMKMIERTLNPFFAPPTSHPIVVMVTTDGHTCLGDIAHRVLEWVHTCHGLTTIPSCSHRHLRCASQILPGCCTKTTSVGGSFKQGLTFHYYQAWGCGEQRRSQRHEPRQ